MSTQRGRDHKFKFQITLVVPDISWYFQDESAWLYQSYGSAPARP